MSLQALTQADIDRQTQRVEALHDADTAEAKLAQVTRERNMLAKELARVITWCSEHGIEVPR